MHRFTTQTGSSQFKGIATLHRLTTRRMPGLLAVAIVLAAAPAFAKDPPKAEIKASGRVPVANSQDHTAAVVIPECLEKLKLSAQQQTEVKEIIQSYNASIGMVWKKYSDRYMQTIEMETSLLAAIEDNLTEAQRQQVRDQRRKTAQHEKVIAATSTRVNQAAVTTTEESAKPAVPVAEGLANAGVTLTGEQEAIADKIQEKYHAQLRSLNRDIQGLHTQLVSLEADKLVEIEKVLTKEQLALLRSTRANAPASPKVATR